MRTSTRLLAAALAVAALVSGGCGNSDTDLGPATAGGTGTRPGDGTRADSAPPTTADLTEFVPLDEPGVTDEEIRVSGIASVSNPLGGNYGDVFSGTEAYFAMVNSQGGVYGRRLTLVAQRDDAVVNNQTEVQAALNRDDAFAVLPVATLLFTGAGDLADAGVPTFGWNIQPEWAGPPNLFGEKGSVVCFECARPYWPWVARHLDRTRVGILAYGISEESTRCAAGVRASFETYPTAEVAFFDDTLPYGIPDLQGEVTEMREAGVDVVLTCMDQNGVVTLAREMQRQGLDAIQFLSNAYDPEFADAFADLFEGSVVALQFWPFEETTDLPPGMVDFQRWIAEVDGPSNELAMAGWLSADLFVSGLRAAGPEFSRQKVIDAINSFTDWDGSGLNHGMDWTVAHDREQDEDCTTFVTIRDGAFQPSFGAPGQPFLCLPDTGDLPDEPELRP